MGCISYISYEECMSCTAVYDMFLRFLKSHGSPRPSLSVKHREDHHGFQYTDSVYPRSYKTESI